MSPTTLQAMSDELTKIASSNSRQAGKLASVHWGKFKHWFNARNATTQGGVIGAIGGSIHGAAKGLLKNDPHINWESGEVHKPTLKRRIGRAAAGAAVGAVGGAAMSAGTGHLLRKLTSG